MEGQVNSEAAEKARKAGLVMIALFGVGTLLFTCGGALLTGVAASGRERDGMMAAQVAIGPGFGALVGLLAAVIVHFAVKENLGLKIGVPIGAAIFGAPCAAGCMFGFFEVIWPSL